MKKKCKESKDKLIINLSDYFVLHKILETANSENQDFSRHSRQERMSILSCPRLKVDFFLIPKGVFFFFRIPVYQRVGVSLVDL